MERAYKTGDKVWIRESLYTCVSCPNCAGHDDGNCQLRGRFGRVINFSHMTYTGTEIYEVLCNGNIGQCFEYELMRMRDDNA